MIALLDNTVLSNFALAGRPELIRTALGDSAAVPEEVLAEHEVGIRRGRVPLSDWSWLTVLQLNEPERIVFDQILEQLNAGEAACLALASARGYRVFTDDRDARELAAYLQVPVSGTLGLLVRLVKQGQLTLPEADDVLHRMIVAGYRAPISSLGELM